MESELLTQIGKLIDEKLAAVSSNFDAKIAEITKANATTLSKVEEVQKLANEAADKAALSAVKEFAKTLGQPAGAAAAPSAPPAAPAPAKKFEDLVKEHPEYTKSKTSAQRAVMLSAPAAYADYRARCEKGEITLF